MEKDTATIAGWFAGRLPDGWFSGTEVTLEGDQIVVVGKLPELELGADVSAEMKAGAAAGRITRFREETRRQRILIAREAEERFEKHVTWGARLGEVTERFTPGGAGRRSSGEQESAKSVMIAGRRRPMRAWRSRFGFTPSPFEGRFGRHRGRRTDGPQVY